MSTTPITTDELRAQAVAAEAAEKEPKPVADPNDPFTITEGENGQVELKLRTGEVFKGTALEVAKAAAKAKVDTTDYSKDLKSQLTQLQEQTNHISQALTPKPPEPSQEEQQQRQLQEFLANENAKYLGFPNAEAMRNHLQGMSSDNAKVRSDRIVMDFMQECPEFPADKEHSDKLIEAGAQYGIFRANQKGELLEEPTAKQMVAAHALCVQLGIYQPLTEAQIQEQVNAGMKIKPRIQARPTPPPMVPSNQPENTPANEASDPWTMDLSKLRNQIIAGQRR